MCCIKRLVIHKDTLAELPNLPSQREGETGLSVTSVCLCGLSWKQRKQTNKEQKVRVPLCQCLGSITHLAKSQKDVCACVCVKILRTVYMCVCVCVFSPLTQLVPELSVLVGHGGALLSPQRQPRVGHELFCDQC